MPYVFLLFQHTLLMSWKLSSPSQEDNPSTATIKTKPFDIVFYWTSFGRVTLSSGIKKFETLCTRYKAQFNDSRQLYVIRGIYGKVKTLINRVASRMNSPLHK